VMGHGEYGMKNWSDTKVGTFTKLTQYYSCGKWIKCAKDRAQCLPSQKVNPARSDSGFIKESLVSSKKVRTFPKRNTRNQKASKI
jgi:hypothetical protein